MQPRWASFLEAAVNVVVGIGLAFLLQLALFDIMVITASLGQSLVLTPAFSVLSLVRAYVLRRLFNGLRPRKLRTVAQHQPAGSGP